MPPKKNRHKMFYHSRHLLFIKNKKAGNGIKSYPLGSSLQNKWYNHLKMRNYIAQTELGTFPRCHFHRDATGQSMDDLMTENMNDT